MRILRESPFPLEIRVLLKALCDVGFSERSLLIGSWVMPICRELYGVAYTLRTLDVDFAVHVAHPRMRLRADLDQLITGIGFSSFLDAEGIQKFSAGGYEPASTNLYSRNSWVGPPKPSKWVRGKPAVAIVRQAGNPPVLRIEQDLPDRNWYGERPRLLKEFRGEPAGRLIVAVDKAAKNYPWPDTCAGFPGPNSNTFTAWISRQVPELMLELPFSAIGSGYVRSAP